MSAPRKGKDISALKARLAKRANPGAAPGGAPATPGAPAPGGVAGGAVPGVPQSPGVPQTGHQPQARPSTAPQRAIPRQPPADSYTDLEATRPAAAQDNPVQPRPAAQAARSQSAPRAAQSTESPFAGGSTFNPDEGLIGGADAGDFKAKGGSKMLVAGVGLGLVGGLALGWMGNIALGKRGKVDIAKAKAGQMIEEVDKVSKARRSLAIEWDGIKKNLATKPSAGASKLKEVMQTHFSDGYAREDRLFGWQLGSMNRATVDSTFSLYRAARELRSDLRDLARFTQNEGKMLNGQAPTRYAVLLRDNNAQMIEFINPVCGADLASAKPCPPNARKKPVGAEIRLAPGEEIKKIPLDKIAILVPRGPYYSAAIAGDPKSQAMNRLRKLVARVDDDLKTMNTAEAATVEGFEKYKGDPNIDKDMP